jgi:hypothetical protein
VGEGRLHCWGLLLLLEQLWYLLLLLLWYLLLLLLWYLLLLLLRYSLRVATATELTLVKCGICISGESLSHRPCVIICDNSIAASAGLSHPLLEITSTIACTMRRLSSNTTFWSRCMSRPRDVREKCDCSSMLALVWASV